MPCFLSPKVLFGKGALERLGPEIEGKGSKTVLITDKTMVKFCERLVETVKDAGYEVKVGDRAEQAPPLDIHIDYLDSQVPPSEDYLFHDPVYPIETYASA